MTAMSLIVQPQAAYLLTDTAHYLADGTAVAFKPKVAEFTLGPIAGAPPAKAAFALTGVVSVEHVQTVCADCGWASIGDVLAGLPDLIRHLTKLLKTALYAPGVGDERSILLALALWDDATGRPDGYLIGNPSCAPVREGHMRPYQLVRMRNYVLARANPSFAGLDYSDPARFSPRRDGGTLLDDQRADPFGDDVTQFTGVGGQGVLTEVGPQGVRYHLLRDWPDRVGEKIALAKHP